MAAAATLLGWRLELSTGLAGHTLGAPEPALLAAVGDVLLMLAAFAMAACATSLVRPARAEAIRF